MELCSFLCMQYYYNNDIFTRENNSMNYSIPLIRKQGFPDLMQVVVVYNIYSSFHGEKTT